MTLLCVGPSFFLNTHIPTKPFYVPFKQWVDVAWPWGLFAIGVQLYTHGTGNWYRTAMISSSFMFAGLRMGLGALLMVPKKKSDFPRYDVGSLGLRGGYGEHCS